LKTHVPRQKLLHLVKEDSTEAFHDG